MRRKRRVNTLLLSRHCAEAFVPAAVSAGGVTKHKCVSFRFVLFRLVSLACFVCATCVCVCYVCACVCVFYVRERKRERERERATCACYMLLL